jgi:hypothetical protein
MPDEILGIGKLLLLGLLYLFLWRVVRTIASDLRDPAPAAPARASVARPAVAEPARRTSARHAPSELVLHPVEGPPRNVPLTGDRIVFGRADHVDEQLDDVYVSDEHAMVVRVEGDWRVRDLGSTNGTYLNGQKVVAPTSIAAGDQIQLGKTRLEVRR